MRKYNIFVKFESMPEFEKLRAQFTDIPNAIEYALEFIEDVNKLRKAIGVNKKLSFNNWYILSDDENIFINYEPMYHGYLVTDFNNLDNKVVYVY